MSRAIADPAEIPVVPSMREIEQLVTEIHRNTERVRENARQLTSMKVEQDIGAGLGVVVVNGYGTLRDIQLDPSTLRYADSSRVSKRILQAVLAAEQKVERIRSERSSRPR
ncbi:MAG: hypothetical protein GEV03_25505 [Streptosporangiales bacterium]|nr:hypothetical protein [Streptosporangiales bacterium]